MAVTKQESERRALEKVLGELSTSDYYLHIDYESNWRRNKDDPWRAEEFNHRFFVLSTLVRGMTAIIRYLLGDGEGV